MIYIGTCHQITFNHFIGDIELTQCRIGLSQHFILYPRKFKHDNVVIHSVLTHWSRDKMASIFQTTFLNAFTWTKKKYVSIKISLKFVSRDPTKNVPSLVQIMAWRRPGDKPFSEPMRPGWLTHISVTRPQWVKHPFIRFYFNATAVIMIFHCYQ